MVTAKKEREKRRIRQGFLTARREVSASRPLIAMARIGTNDFLSIAFKSHGDGADVTFTNVMSKQLSLRFITF